MKPPAAVLQQHRLSNPTHIAETTIAHIWKVTRTRGEHAALKIYKDGDAKGEDIGFRLTKALDGTGTAKTYHFAKDTAVMEWLDGPPLGDLSRAGQDDDAAQKLIRVADQIHSVPTDIALTPLVDHFKPLLGLRINPSWPRQTQHNIGYTQQLAQQLVGNQQNIRCLHGDLHHDNIKHSARGCLAYDAKGLIGDRGYELANAFQNPLGADDLATDPARAGNLAETWAGHWNMRPKRLLSWAAAHCGLSMTWGQNFSQALHMQILDMLRTLAQADD